MRDRFLFLTQLLADCEGVTAMEYGIIAALIAVAIISAVAATGGSLTNLYNSITAAI